jgi:hypothetical protein
MEQQIRSSKITINQCTSQYLAQHEPSALIKFVDASDERQYLYHTKVAEHRHKECQARETTIRLLMAGVGGLIIVVFIYTSCTKDQTLPRNLMTFAMTAVGGARALKVYGERVKNQS